MLTQAQSEYKRLTLRLGFTMLLFVGLFFGYSMLMPALQLLFTLTLKNAVLSDILYEIVYGLLYAACFALPVYFFRLISPENRSFHVRTEWKLPSFAPLYIFAGIAVIMVAAYLNAYLLEIFHYNDFIGELTDESYTQNYQLILAFFTTAVVPGFVEEFLFRGLILEKLLPYGRETAVIFSALLFGLMHQNAGQFLYATVAGLVLGYLYVITRSIWCGVLLHFSNNFFSVLMGALSERLPGATGNAVTYLINFAVMAVGFTAAVFLLFRAKDNRLEAQRSGCFGRSLPLHPDAGTVELPWRDRVRLFFPYSMIIFTVIACLEMGGYLLMAVLR